MEHGLWVLVNTYIHKIQVFKHFMDLKVNYISRALLELSSFSQIPENGGFVIRCYSHGRIELFEILEDDKKEILYGSFKTINAALEVAETWI